MSVAQLTEKQRDKLPDADFAYVDRSGEGHLPIHDESHVRNAIARWSQTHFESKAARERARKAILAAAERFGVEVSEDAKVRKPDR